MFAPLLRELKRRREVELRVISNREPVLPDVEYVWRPWSAESEVEDLSHFDIGIMPMPDDEWSKGKCALKALQYMAMGVPTICSAVGANCEVIQHGVNGLLAASDEEWIRNLELLIDDPALRQRLGPKGRRTVEERYSMNACAELFAGVVRQTVEEKQRVAATVERSAVQVQREN
jgi:glycosyltransferase involved in cell wall biosynthesis